MENTDKVDDSQDESVTQSNTDEKEQKNKEENPDEEQTKDSFIEFVDKTSEMVWMIIIRKHLMFLKQKIDLHS